MDELYDHQKVQDCIGICADVVKDAGCNLFEAFRVFEILKDAAVGQMKSNANLVASDIEQVEIDAI